MQAYSNQKRAADAHALPDVEVFEVWAGTPYDECPLCDFDAPNHASHKAEHCGFYWHACFPGCLPDGEPRGPFVTQAEALADAQEGNSDDEDDGLPLPTKPIPFGTDGCLSRDSDGTWPSRADGGYPIVYYLGDGEECCPACANGAEGSEAHESAEASQWRIAGSDIYWEGPPLECAHCGAAIESAYGDPDDEPDDDESDDPS